MFTTKEFCIAKRIHYSCLMHAEMFSIFHGELPKVGLRFTIIAQCINSERWLLATQCIDSALITDLHCFRSMTSFVSTALNIDTSGYLI